MGVVQLVVVFQLNVAIYTINTEYFLGSSSEELQRSTTTERAPCNRVNKRSEVVFKHPVGVLRKDKWRGHQ